MDSVGRTVLAFMGSDDRTARSGFVKHGPGGSQNSLARNVGGNLVGSELEQFVF